MVGKAIMAAAEGRNRCLDGRRRVEGGGWRGRRPERQTPRDTIQSERSSVAVSTFPSASKCQAAFTHTNTQEAVRAPDGNRERKTLHDCFQDV